MQAILIRHMLIFITSLFSGYYLIPLIVQAAYRLRVLDLPDGKIKVHERPVPYLGGVAVYLSFVVSLALFYPLENTILWLLLGSTMLLFVGLIDDLLVLKPGQKFLGQIAATLCFLKGGFCLKSVFFSSYINFFLSGFWMLSIINAFNLIDVMDGLSSLVALMVSGSFFFMALFFQRYDLSLLLLAFMGSVFAFFMNNKPPAKIYLGDAGALFIGGFLSAIPLLMPWSSQSFEAYYAAPVIFIVPLFELFFLVVIRTWIGIPFYRGSPHHFAIYLQNKGWTKNNILCFIGCFSFLAFVAATCFLVGLISLYALITIVVFLFCLWTNIVFMQYFQQKNIQALGSK